jgi:hypothetical protein
VRVSSGEARTRRSQFTYLINSAALAGSISVDTGHHPDVVLPRTPQFGETIADRQRPHHAAWASPPQAQRPLSEYPELSKYSTVHYRSVAFSTLGGKTLAVCPSLIPYDRPTTFARRAVAWCGHNHS